MEYNFSKPSAFLSQYIKQYWGLDNYLPANTEHTQRIVPTGLFELIFYLHDKPVSSNKDKSISDSIILSGHQKDYYDLRVTGKLSIFAIYFHPHGLSMFLDLPLKEIFDQSIPLRFVLKDSVNKLEDDLAAAHSFEEKIKISETFLISRITNNEKKYQYERIRNTINSINQAKGIVDIDALASESCLSRKQFERTFSEIIGASPKKFLKIVRFQNAIFQKTKCPNISLSELAFICGYYDLAHMANEFKSLSGYTPKQYFTDCTPFSDYFE